MKIGVETSEQLDIIPQQVRVIQHQRIKYACPCCDHGIKVTPAPARIIPSGLLTEAALAWVATSKYQDPLPLYRQAALIGRFGGDLSRNTLAGGMVKVGGRLSFTCSALTPIRLHMGWRGLLSAYGVQRVEAAIGSNCLPLRDLVRMNVKLLC